MNKSTNKKSKMLSVISISLQIISIFLLLVFTASFIKQIQNENLSNAMGFILSLIFCFIPGIIITTLSFLFSVLALKANNNPVYNKYKIIFVSSIIISIMYLIEFVIINII